MHIYWDITKLSKNRSFSGLNRVSQRLREALELQGCKVIPVAWSVRNTRYLEFPSRKDVYLTEQDVFITPELFNNNERQGSLQWIRNSKGLTVAIFHDAIPLKHPEFTWPKSVARHPSYMKELAEFDLILANSEHSREELIGYWNWLELAKSPPVSTIPLGADFAGHKRETKLRNKPKVLHLLMVGILEPRKNHEVVLSAMEILRTQGKNVQLSIVGRVNPHFGKPIVKRIENLIQSGLPILYHRQIEDKALLKLYEKADIALFPSRVEGNGLPVIESLWRGIPTIASPIPPHREHAQNGGGVLILDPMDPSHLASTIDTLIDQPEKLKALQADAISHALPTWSDSAEASLKAIASARSL